MSDCRLGRAFLAGDAAHVHSPAGGQGMNTGMQDAINLAWKLALVTRGVVSDRILESYSLERGPVAEEVLKATGRITSMATTTSETVQFLRNHTASLILGLGPVRRMASKILSETAIAYTHSPLNARPAHRDPLPGHRAPIREGEPIVGAGNSPRFALAGESHGVLGDGRPADLQQRYGPLLEPSFLAPYRADGLWLVRPDGYVAVAARAGDWEAMAGYLDNLIAGLPCMSS